MLDNILSAAALVLFAAVTVAAPLHHAAPIPAAEPAVLVVTLPAVEVTGQRMRPAPANLLAEVE